MAHPKGSAEATSKRTPVVRILALAALAAIAVILWLVGRPAPVETTPADESDAAFTPLPGVPETIHAIAGKWLREDGGYVLEIIEGRAGGHLEAAYFNPRRINVSRAAWMERANGLQVFIELNDVGYPGSTYMLLFDPAKDVLAGTYTQPQFQQEFAVEFVRPRK